MKCALPFLIGLGTALGQSTPLTFEVASVRRHEGPTPNIGVSTNGQTLDAAASPFLLIMDAYNLKYHQISAASRSWLIGEVYDVVAMAGGDHPPTRDEFRKMLQALLAERFQLRFHHEMKEMAVYALVAGPRGSKLKPSAPDAVSMGRAIVQGRNYVVSFPKATMDNVINAITGAFVDRPVVDHTGLTGTYDLTLTYTPDIPANRRGEPDPNDINIFTAVQEQLGLKLEPRREMVDTLIIDSIEKPSDN